MAAPRFYFAWADAAEITFSAGTHARVDEEVVSINIEHSEGDFAGLTVEIRNPRIGLLEPARKVWAWLSYDGGNGTATPLFFGRLVGVPNDIHKEIVTLVFIARPADFNYQKSALAETLKVSPYWDPIFISKDKRDDPDAVLEARTQLWHIDRISHDVTVSDLLVGEDGLEDFAASEVPYESVGVTIKENPIRSVEVIGSVKWTQEHRSADPIVVYKNAVFPTLPTGGLKEIWPKTGDDLGGGWSVALGTARLDTDNIVNKSSSVTSADGKISLASSGPVPEPIGFKVLTAGQSKSGAGGASSSYNGIWVATPTLYGSLSLGYVASNERTERVSITIRSDVQDLVTLPGEDETQIISIAGVDVGLPLDDGGTAIPIGSKTRRSFFTTSRGLPSIEYLMLIGRATLVLRSRAVEVIFQCSFERALELSLRKNARVHDDRIPGGVALGKIVRYAIRADGGGDMRGEVTIACAIGTAGTVAASPGTPTYVEEGYFNTGEVQFYENQTVVLGTSDVGYTVPRDAPNDGGLSFPVTEPFLIAPSITHVRINGNGSESDVGDILPPMAGQVFGTQPSFRNPTFGSEAEEAINKYVNAVEARMSFTLRPVTGSKFVTEYVITTTGLQIPAGVNLGAL